ncbi:MAG: aldo/keto reductase [Gammaproteobacteria bacterium]|nr:aldo/keto reductase [Gammaproteobacteria bacterium]
MSDRREFLQLAGAVALTALASPFSMARQRSLPLRTIPGTDEGLAVVGLGNSNAFRRGDFETSRQLLKTFFGHGGRYVDCSGDGANLVASIAGNLGHSDTAFLGSYFNGEYSAQSEAAVQRLRAINGGNPLDLIHTYPEDGVPNWDVLRKWKDNGLARFIGLARHNARYYEAMMKVMESGTMDFVQVNLSPLETEAEDRLLPMAMDKGIAVTINRPFINGRYFSIVKGHALPAWAVEFDCTSWAQFSIKYVLSHPAVTCVLTETANPEHLLDNLGGGFGRLPDEESRVRMRQLVQSFS